MKEKRGGEGEKEEEVKGARVNGEERVMGVEGDRGREGERGR